LRVAFPELGLAGFQTGFAAVDEHSLDGGSDFEDIAIGDDQVRRLADLRESTREDFS